MTGTTTTAAGQRDVRRRPHLDADAAERVHPGITQFTNDRPFGPPYDFGGDPGVALAGWEHRLLHVFRISGKQVALWLSRSTDGGRTWTAGGLDHPLTLVSAFQGEGKARGSNGQFPTTSRSPWQ